MYLYVCMNVCTVCIVCMYESRPQVYIFVCICMYVCMYAVCDGCFNRLVYEASQPSPDHFRVRQLKQCAVDAIRAIEQLIDSLDDPEGDPHNFNAALKDTEVGVYVCMYVCMYVCLYGSIVYVCVYVYMDQLCMYVCMYI